MAELTDFWKNKETADYFSASGAECEKYYNEYIEDWALKNLSITDIFSGDEAEAVKNFAKCEDQLLCHVRYLAHSANSMMSDIEDAFIDDMDEVEDANYNRKSIKELRDWFKDEGKEYKSHSTIIKLIYDTLTNFFSEFGTYTDPKFDSTIDGFDEICGYPERNESCFLKQVDSRFENFIDHADRIYKDYDIDTLILSSQLTLRKAVESIGNGKNLTPDIDTSYFGVDELNYNEWYKYEVKREVFGKAFGLEYGGDQGSLADLYNSGKIKYKDLEYILKKYDRSKNLTEKEVGDLLSQLNNEGCSYVANINIILEMYEGREEDFYKDFGIPMYKVHAFGRKTLNYNEILLDFYLSEDDHCVDADGNDYYDEDPTGANSDEMIYRVNRYLIGKGLDPIDIEKLLTVSEDEIRDELKKGNSVVIIFKHGNLYNKDGSVYQYIDGHAMVVTGVSDDGRFIVSSWGDKYYVDPVENSGIDEATSRKYLIYRISEK